VTSELGEKHAQVTPREGPIAQFCGALTAVLEVDQTAFEHVDIGEIARRAKLALNDRELYLDLVEPAGMVRRVDQHEVWPFGS
jgi:hypothetical protein